MLMNDSVRNQIGELLSLALELEISQEQIDTLNRLLKNNPERIRYAINYLQINSALKRSSVVAGMQEMADADSFTNSLIQIAEYEKTAPAIEISEEKPSRELIQKVVYPPRGKRKISKLNIVILVMNAAALLFFILFLKFAPSKAGVDVATLTDSIDAKWADNAASYEKGVRMAAGNDSLLLRDGYAELLFDTNARVVIEAPAEFQIVANDRISLNYGKIYAKVPTEAIGFSVYTPNSKIIDLGTEFGVEADFRGETQLHVIQGMTKLISGQHSDKISIEVRQGEAKKISADTSKISDISCESNLFVRNIDSTIDLIWKGQTSIDLADIVGGGNGFGAGKLDSGIETNTGRRFLSPDPALVQSKITGILTGGGVYNKVSELPFVDGVFVPDGRDGAVQITSAGHTFDGFVYGREVFWGNIFNGAWHASDQTLKHQLELNGQTYGTDDNPAISLHSSQGITFDLQAIRQTVPGGKILQFTSLFGVSETVARVPSFDPNGNLNTGKVNCWVLIDGKERFNRDSVSCLEGAIAIEVDIHDEDRFLTLVVTESDDRRAYDWAIFAKPFLQIEMDTN